MASVAAQRAHGRCVSSSFPGRWIAHRQVRNARHRIRQSLESLVRIQHGTDSPPAKIRISCASFRCSGGVPSRFRHSVDFLRTSDWIDRSARSLLRSPTGASSGTGACTDGRSTGIVSSVDRNIPATTRGGIRGRSETASRPSSTFRERLVTVDSARSRPRRYQRMAPRTHQDVLGRIVVGMLAAVALHAHAEGRCDIPTCSYSAGALAVAR